MPAVPIRESRRAIQYTGSNAHELAEVINSFAVVDEADRIDDGHKILDGTLTFRSGGADVWHANVGDWVTLWQGVVLAVLSPEVFARRWDIVDTPGGAA